MVSDRSLDLIERRQFGLAQDLVGFVDFPKALSVRMPAPVGMRGEGGSTIGSLGRAIRHALEHPERVTDRKWA